MICVYAFLYAIMCASTSPTVKQGKYASCDGTITYAEFSSDIEAITRISNEIFDNWQLKRVTQNDGTEKSYLTKTETKLIELEDESEPLSCSLTYHVVYHQSYQVPCLGFNVYRLGKALVEPYYGRYIGPLKQFGHGIKGDLYAVDESTIFLKVFSYDGTGPDAFFWVGKTPRPSTEGYIFGRRKTRVTELKKLN